MAYFGIMWSVIIRYLSTVKTAVIRIFGVVAETGIQSENVVLVEL